MADYAGFGAFPDRPVGIARKAGGVASLARYGAGGQPGDPRLICRRRDPHLRRPVLDLSHLFGHIGVPAPQSLFIPQVGYQHQGTANMASVPAPEPSRCLFLTRPHPRQGTVNAGQEAQGCGNYAENGVKLSSCRAGLLDTWIPRSAYCFLAQASDRGEDVVGRSGLSIGHGFLVVRGDEGDDIGFEFRG